MNTLGFALLSRVVGFVRKPKKLIVIGGLVLIAFGIGYLV